MIEVPDLEATDINGAEAILFGERGSVPVKERDRPTPAWMREVVLAREGHSCAICGSRRDCRVHHVDSRADGGRGLETLSCGRTRILATRRALAVAPAY